MTTTGDSESTFGDWEPADSIAHGEPDPESAAQRFHEIVSLFESKRGPWSTWADLREEDREVAVLIMSTFIEWLTSEGSL